MSTKYWPENANLQFHNAKDIPLGSFMLISILVGLPTGAGKGPAGPDGVPQSALCPARAPSKPHLTVVAALRLAPASGCLAWERRTFYIQDSTPTLCLLVQTLDPGTGCHKPSSAAPQLQLVLHE